MRKFFTVIPLLLALIGCANPSIVRVKAAEIEKIKISKIFIPRFEGRPEFVEESTELFVATIEKQISGLIIQGGGLRTESTDIIAGGNIAPMELAIVKAKEVNAQLVILGKVTSHNTGGLLNGFSTIKVINVANGEIVASFHRPSGLLFANSEHQCVMEAVGLTADDVAKVLK